MGLATMGLFALQFIVGFFSFLLLLCCESATASFRANLVPIHSTFGITTFVMAVATCCSGLTEKAFFTLSSQTADKADREVFAAIADEYTESIEGHHQALVINVLGGCLVLLAILIPFILKCDAFRKGVPMEGKTGNEDSEEED
jgi:hypothetical protein